MIIKIILTVVVVFVILTIILWINELTRYKSSYFDVPVFGGVFILSLVFFGACGVWKVGEIIYWLISHVKIIF